MSLTRFEGTEESVSIMIAVANGHISLQDFGRWIATHNPARATELPQHMREVLTVRDLDRIATQMVVGRAAGLSPRPDFKPRISDGPGVM